MPNLAKRILTAVVGIPIVLWLIYGAPSIVWVIALSLVAALAGREYAAIVAADSRRIRWIQPLASAAIVALIASDPISPRSWAFVATFIPLLALLSHIIKPADVSAAPAKAALLAFGMLYTGVLPALIAIIRVPSPHFVVLLLSVAFLGDTGAYTAGRIFGRHPLSALSPKKTWEGSIGGLLASALAGAVASLWYLPTLPIAHGIILGLGCGVLGQLGDLSESLLKRAYGVKDSGNILPGHGGLLDRIDGVLFAAAGLFLYVLLK